MSKSLFKRLFLISRRLFSIVLVNSVPYTIIYFIIALFRNNLSWHFYFKSLQVIALALIFLFGIGAIFLAISTAGQDDITDEDLN